MAETKKRNEKRLDFLYLSLILLGLFVLNRFFPVFTGPVLIPIVAASFLSLYLHIIQFRYRKTKYGPFLAGLSGVYNPLALTGLIVLVDYNSAIWLLLFLVNMLRNPNLGFEPSVLSGIVTVLCFDYLAIKIYHFKTFEIIFGSFVFFTAAVLAWVLALKVWLFEQQSMRDSLTGLRNRRSLNLSLKQEIKQCLQNDQPISLLMIDLDNFKKYNDTLGHVKGDEVLKEMAGIMTGNIRNGDHIFRYGGEEFCIILPGVSQAGAQKIAERIRDHVERAFTGQEVPVTVSIGVSSSEGEIPDARYLIELADKAMYRAKILKNRVIAS